MPISRVGVKIGDVRFNSNDVHFSLNTHRDNAGLPVLHNLQTTVMVQVEMHDSANLPFDKLKSLFERAKLPTGKNITDMEINFWSDDAKNDIVCSYHFKGWLSRFETFTAGGVNGVLALELCPVINDQTGANVTMDQESS
jgi:hypothetical protein